jgi:hypothetical protein
VTPGDENERISKLRALIEAEGDAPRFSAPAARDTEPSSAPSRSPLVLVIGGGVLIAVVVIALLVLGGDSGVKQPEGTTSRRVSVFPTRITGGIDKGERVTICDDKAGGALAADVVVFGLGEEKVPLYGRTVLIDAYIPDDLVGRFQGKNLGDFAVVQGSCGEVSTTTTETTATTSPPTTVTTAPIDSSVPTQPPDQGGPQ